MIEPYLLGDPHNFSPANSMVTPKHIQPEWYFLFAYAILRSIPNKLRGVVALLLSIVILIFVPYINKYKFLRLSIYPLNQFIYWFLIINFILLTWIGIRPVESPYVITGQVLTICYFSYFIIDPIIKYLWDKLID